MTAENKQTKAIERFFNENKGMLPPAVERLIREIMGEYANGDSVLLQKSELQAAFASVINETLSDDGTIGENEKQKIIDAVEQVQAASSLSEKAVMGILDIFDEMRTLVNEIDQDDVRASLNKKISESLELCTFEDIAAQHMGRALKLMQQTCSDEPQEQQEGEELLSGPALPEEESISQEEIDKLLKGG